MSDNGWRVTYRLAILALACYMTANVGAAYIPLFVLSLFNPVRTPKLPRPDGDDHY